MAASNMIVTLAMNATKYASGLRTAGAKTKSFGDYTTKAFNVARGAMLGLTLAVLRYVPTILNMGAESRKADIQLQFMLETMNGVSAETAATTKRMAAYADQVNKATGIDDEQVKAVQRKLLVFKSLRGTADELNGTFDRATQAAIDLAAGGFGSMETNAIKLGRVLENPIANLNALSRAGITFTEQEKRKIAQLIESGKQFEAQDLILKSIENRVSGLAEASATPFEKLQAQFEQIGDAIGEQMLGPLEEINKEVSVWLGTPQGRKDVEAIADAFVEGAKGVRDMALFLREVKGFLDGITSFNMDWVSELRNFRNDILGISQPGARGDNSGRGQGNEPFGGTSRMGRAGITVNFNSPVDSVSAGREVARVLADYSRANGVR
jgi:hypothetical protein